MIIDARAAARREIGGVERVTMEMAARLPQLRPDRYAVMRPPGALAYRAGHLWEQALLPAAARQARVLYCPANLAPAVSSRTVVVIHDLAALRHPGWYSPVYASYQQQILPLLARRARLVIAPSEFSRDELVEGLGLDPDRIAVVPQRRGRPLLAARPTPSRCGAPTGSSGPTCWSSARASRARTSPRSQTARARLREHGIELVSAGSGRAYMRPGEAPPMRALGYVDDDDLPGLYAGRAGARDAVALRGLRPARAGGDGQRRAGGRRRPHRAAGDLRRRRAAGRPRRRRRARRRAARGHRRRAGARAPDRAPGSSAPAQFSWDRSARLTDAAIAQVLEQDEPIVPRAAARRRERPPRLRTGRGGLDDHRQPRAPRPARRSASSRCERALRRGGRGHRADRRRQRLARRLGRAGARALPRGQGGRARAQRGLRRRRLARHRGGPRRVDRRLQQRHDGRAGRRGG